MKPSTRAALDELKTEMVEILRPVVFAIERGPQLTKGHYETYMSVIASVAAKFETEPGLQSALSLVIGLALLDAGANTFGVREALRAMGHLPL